MDRLFDQFIRTRQEHADHQMPAYTFLNMSAWESAEYFRSLIEEWYSSFPRDREFYGNFVSEKNNQHYSAIFELFIFTIFARSGFQVKYNHPIGSRRVDLFAEGEWGSFLLDCTLSGEPNVNNSIRIIESSILDVVEAIPSPFYWVGVEFEKGSQVTPSLSKIRKITSKAIEDATRRNARELYTTFDESGWLINFHVLKKNPPIDRTLGSVVSSQGGGFVDGESARLLRTTLNSKRGSSYQIGTSAFIIAVNTSNVFVNDEIISDTLYGSFNGDKTELIDSPFFLLNGVPQNTSVSAVLICRGLHWSNMGRVELELWHNPWARAPLTKSIKSLTQINPHLSSDGLLERLVRTPGLPMSEVLGISKDYI